MPNDNDSDDESEPEQQHEVSNMQDIETLSASLEWLKAFLTQDPTIRKWPDIKEKRQHLL